MRLSVSKPLVKADALTRTESMSLSYLCSTESKSDTTTGISMRTNIPEQKIRISMLCLQDAGLVHQEGQFYAPSGIALKALYTSRMLLLRRSESQKSSPAILRSRLYALSGSILNDIGDLVEPEAAEKGRTELSKAEKAASAAANRLEDPNMLDGMSKKQIKKMYSDIIKDASLSYTDDARHAEYLRQRLICAINIVNSMTLECLVTDDSITSRIMRSDVNMLENGLSELKRVIKTAGMRNDSRLLEALYSSNLRNISLLDSESVVIRNHANGMVYVFSTGEDQESLMPISSNSVEASVILGNASEAIDYILS